MATIPEGVIIMWPKSLASKPDGWDVVTAFYSRFPKGTAACTDPSSTTGGAATHTHTADNHDHAGASHNHTWTLPVTTTTGRGPIATGGTQYYVLNKDHTHPSTTSTMTATTSGSTASSWDTVSPNVLYYDMIKLESDGTPTGFPDDSVVLYDAGSAPTGWGQHAASVGDFPSTPATCGNGAAGGGSTGGGTHTHSAGASHVHTAGAAHNHGTQTSGNQSEVAITHRFLGIECYWRMQCTHNHDAVFCTDATGSASAATSGASGTVSSPHSGGQYEPPYRKYLGIENTSGSNNWLEDAICMWLGDLDEIPTGWTLITDMIGKFPKFAAAGGGDNDGTGGCVAHNHAVPSDHSHPASAHNHDIAISGYANAPVYNTSRYYMLYPCCPAWVSNHPHPTSTSGCNSTAYGCEGQDLNNNACTQPAFKTVAFISAPAEPTSGNIGMFGANF